MTLINVANVINMLTTTFQIASIAQTPVTPSEIEMHNEIHDIIQNFLNVHSVSLIEHDYVLDFADPSEPHGAQVVEYITAAEEEEDNFEPEECIVDNEGGKVDFSYKRKAVEFWKSGKKARRSFTTVQRNFRKVKSLQLYRWEASVEKGGTNADKFQFIAEYVLQKFEEASDRRSIVHDMNLRFWALEAKDQMDLPEFKASKWWIWKFKNVHRIVSRKITTFRMRSTLQDIGNLQNIAESFVLNVRSDIPAIGVEEIYNADESGFNLEIYSGRTLAKSGVKTVEAMVQSVSSTTHSYTIMPIISASGRLLSPLYIVLKESTGTFGPRVQETLFRPVNIYIQASKSGKLTSEHFKTWFSEVYVPNTGRKSMLLLDSWTGHCPSQLEQLIPQDKEVKFSTIPKKTTTFIQPLDVFGFRIWKKFVRTFSDNVILQEKHVNLHSRNEIIKLQSLTHNQLSSPRFKNLFQYAWFKSGYLETHPGEFQNPVDFCYFRKEKHIPKCSICGLAAFMRCAWCGEYFCFKHFYEEYHYCTNYIA
ncbi:uncharacterized protein LOC116849335 isoform X2 [Odontomachus brunneus]|uniref:uncharacterized protein LOC116849335 isoform X2 n=1 Tax=Odontomachus brunneus TaxID=486640 RepID=UPI0013F2142D|nr:uncharacterized protein LOC116849335 isoform X2 [Odontomachus brunneus]